MAEQTTSSQEMRLQTSFRLVNRDFMGLQSEEILYLKMRLHAGEPCRTVPLSAFGSLFHAIADFAVLHAISEVNDHADDEPNDQAQPRDAIQSSHQSQRNNDSHDGNKRDQGCPERALKIRPTNT